MSPMMMRRRVHDEGAAHIGFTTMADIFAAMMSFFMGHYVQHEVQARRNDLPAPSVAVASSGNVSTERPALKEHQIIRLSLEQSHNLIRLANVPKVPKPMASVLTELAAEVKTNKSTCVVSLSEGVSGEDVFDAIAAFQQAGVPMHILPQSKSTQQN